MQSRRTARELTSPAEVARAVASPMHSHVAGRVVAHDSTPSNGFTVQDDTGFLHVVSPDLPPLGAFVTVEGSWNGRDLTATQLVVVSAGNDHFSHANSDFTFLSGKRLANLRARHEIMKTLRAFYDAEGLLEVETPAIVPCPGLDVQLDAIEVLGMRAPRWLHTSPEYQMKRLLTTGLPGVYQIGKAFRRGERGKLHEPEFTMLEWYRTFADANDMMRDTEAAVARVAQALYGKLALPGLAHAVDVTPPWDRISVKAAFERYAGVDVDELHDDDRFYRLLIEKVEPELGRGRATFLTHYPVRMASLARVAPEDPRYAERFEGYLDGVELCNGFSELIDAAEQRKRLQADQAVRSKLGRSVYPIDERFMTALEDGIPPSGGNALGVDRLVMLALGAKHIDEVIAFSAART